MAALATLLLSDQLAWALMVVQTACISLAEGYIASTGSPSSPLAQHCSAKSSGGEQTLSSTQSRRRGEDRDIGMFQKKGLDTPGTRMVDTIMHAQSLATVIDCAWRRGAVRWGGSFPAPAPAPAPAPDPVLLAETSLRTSGRRSSWCCTEARSSSAG